MNGQGMSEERLAACRDLPRLIRRQVWRTAEDAADAIRDLTAEVDQLRARLAEIGETRQEWAVRWRTAGGRYAYELCDNEQEAREAAPDDGLHEIVKRVAGEWLEVQR